MWNNLDDNIKKHNLISSFKHYIQTIFFKYKVPSYGICQYNMLSRVRNNCNNLNNDLLNNHLRDNPLCSWCNEIEDGEHYFFYCNSYSNERRLFFETVRDVQALTINLLHVVYDNETMDNAFNIALFSAVHEYIKNT